MFAKKISHGNYIGGVMYDNADTLSDTNCRLSGRK